MKSVAKGAGVPIGIHIVAPNPQEVQLRTSEGYSFIAYSTDAQLLVTKIKTDLAFLA